MAVIVCTSATGAPGVTTTTLGLALAWPRDVLLADCDRDPAQSVQAGYLRGLSFTGRGLNAVSRAQREGHPLAQHVWLQAVPLSSGTAPDRRFLPGFTHPGSAGLFEGAWTDLGHAFAELSGSGVDVLVDAGRAGRAGLPPGLIGSADVVLLLVNSTLRSLAATRLYLSGMAEQVASHTDRGTFALGVVGDQRPYSAAEISAQFELPVWLTLAHDPESASVYLDGQPEPKRFADAALPRSLRAGASSLLDQVNQLAAERAGLRRTS
ncbi:MAG: hypothetical protein Q3997_04735 [Propionibacteriaceae bacterium]|nr:hypothetical protein [Propionibacteriaceae bacterium]